ncbi:Glutathione transport system permease protein GsiD [compost metagenome]
MSVLVGVSAVLLSLCIGVPLGLVAGYAGGWFDTLLMRLADVQLTFPVILAAMLILGIVRGVVPEGVREHVAVLVIILAIALSDWL